MSPNTVAADLALVRDPAIVLSMSRAEIENLRGTTREIAALIAELPWVSTNMGVLAAALFAFGVPDDLIAYCEWLHRCPAEKAA